MSSLQFLKCGFDLFLDFYFIFFFKYFPSFEFWSLSQVVVE